MRRFARARCAALLTLGCALLSLGNSTSRAQSPSSDPLDSLAKARETYESALEKARAKLEADVDKRIDVAKKVGRPEVVEELKREKERFLAEGVLPESQLLAAEVKDYRSAWRVASRVMIATLQTAERDLTRADRLDAARQMQEERKLLQARIDADNPAPPPPPSEADPAHAFQADTRWQGFLSGVGRRGKEAKKAANIAFALHVTERDGDHFRGTFGPDGRGAEIEGTLGKTIKTPNGRMREFSFYITKNLRNPDAPVGPATTNTGRIRDGYLEGVQPPVRQGDKVLAARYELSLQQNPSRGR